MLLNSCAVFIDAHTVALYAHNSVNFPQVLQKEQKQSTRKRPVKHSRRLFFFFCIRRLFCFANRWGHSFRETIGEGEWGNGGCEKQRAIVSPLVL